MLDEVFARNPDGIPVTLHFRLTCDREDLTRLFTCCALGWLHLTDEQVLWSTSNPETAREAFSHLRSAIGRPELRRHVERIRAANGTQEIRLRHDPRLLVRSRRINTRGLRVLRLVIDQAQAFTDWHASNLLSIASRPGSQVVYGVHIVNAGETTALMELVARRNSKRLATRTAVLVYAALTGHVHYLARDGEWCVTVTQVGMLWEHLRRAGERTP